MFWKDYTGADATLEILIMLLGAFLLGAALMYFYDKYFFECVDEDEEKEDNEEEYYKVEANDYIVDLKENSTDDDNSENIVVIEETSIKEDDLKIVEGIGPKIESILKSKGIKTLKDLSETSADEVKEILTEVGGEKYAFHDPTTWADQAKLAAEGNFEELKEYQSFLRGGKI